MVALETSCYPAGMMDRPPEPHPHVRVYRSAAFYRRRRRFLVATAAVALGLVVVVVAGVWAWQAHSKGPEAGLVGTRPGGGAGAAAAGSPTSPSPSPPSASAASRVITIGWVGDTTPGSKYGLPPDGGRALFAHIRAQLRAPDLMMANLEGTYSTPGPSKSDGSTSGTSFSFQAPPSYAAALRWSGIDLVNVANNHAFDYFQRGLDQTTSTLEKNHVAYAGLPRQVTVTTVKGVRVAVVGFSPYPWSADINDIPAAQALVRRAAQRADVVVVLMHAGAEGADKIHTPTGTETAFGENRGDPRAFAHAVIDAGADLVLGSGPHVIRGIERYRNRLIAHSLGNFAGWHNFGLGGNLSLSGLLTIRIDGAGRLHGGRWLSLYVAQPGVPVVDPSDAAAHLARQLSAADFPRTWRMDVRGKLTPQ